MRLVGLGGGGSGGLAVLEDFTILIRFLPVPLSPWLLILGLFAALLLSPLFLAFLLLADSSELRHCHHSFSSL